MFMAVGLADGSSNNEDDAVWSPLYLAVNGAFTVLITARILCVTDLQLYADAYAYDSILCRRTSFGTSRSILITAGRTVVESALISWVGVFVMLLTDYYPYVGISLIQDAVKIISCRPVVWNAHGVNIQYLGLCRAFQSPTQHCLLRCTTCSRRIFASDIC
jgi:hypothetical protein